MDDFLTMDPIHLGVNVIKVKKIFELLEGISIETNGDDQ
jgi:hypothetical protein